jgi:hypothetical protein
MRRRPTPVSWYLCVYCTAAIAVTTGVAAKPPLNRAAERWVEETKKKLTLNEKIGQLIVPAFESGFLSTDSDLFDEVSRLVREYHVGGFHVFGASVPAPAVLLNSSWCPL